MKKIVLVLMVLLSLTLSGCSSDSGYNKLEEDFFNDVDTDPTPPAPTQEEIILEGGDVIQSASTPALLNRKIIYTADLRMMSLTPVDLYNEVLSILGTHSAYVESEDISETVFAIKIRVLSDNLDDLLDDIKQEGEVVSFTRTSEDITNAYSTFESRKLALETQQARIIELIEVAVDLDDIITLEQARADIESELNQIGDSLANYDSLVDYSTVNLTIRLKTEQEVILPQTESPSANVVTVGKDYVNLEVTNRNDTPALIYVDLLKNGEFIKQYEKEAFPDGVADFSIAGLKSNTEYSFKITSISADERESRNVTAVALTESTFFNKVGNIFGSSFEVLVTILEFAGLTIVALLPFVIVGAIIFVPSRIYYKKHGKSYLEQRRQKKQKMMEQRTEERIKREEELNFKRYQHQKMLREQATSVSKDKK